MLCVMQADRDKHDAAERAAREQREAGEAAARQVADAQAAAQAKEANLKQALQRKEQVGYYFLLCCLMLSASSYCTCGRYRDASIRTPNSGRGAVSISSRLSSSSCQPPGRLTAQLFQTLSHCNKLRHDR